jgi:poly(A) polymerase
MANNFNTPHQMRGLNFMNYKYIPKNNLEKFGYKIYSSLVENFSQTFYVGGMVRDILLKKKVGDIDIATEATPEEVISILKRKNISFNLSHKNFGIVVASYKNLKVEIATFRKDVYTSTRYPKVSFCKTPKEDSKRRDFNINALYLSPKLNKIFDFQNGLKDLNNNKIKFIGSPDVRIKEDPLRILRGIRFALNLNFSFEEQTKKFIEKNFYLVNTLTKTKIENEILKIKNIKLRNNLKNNIFNKKLLDITLKKF